MAIRLSTLAVVLLLTACGKKAATEDLPPATCDVQAKRYGDVLTAAFTKQGIAIAQPGAVTAAIVSACKDDHWPDSVTSCLSACKDGKDTFMEACINSLPPELEQKMDTRVKAVLTPAK